ncbi:MAG: glycine oxidase ThiO [Acidobacteria bacterium]|nr:glycine oxidase ThiO [Acidobacteriota bacterium]
MAQTLSSTKTADVVIIGGGIIGSAIALRLARSGVKVSVIDRAEPGAEASGAAAGMIAPQGEMLEPDPFFELCTASRDLYQDFVTEVEDLSGERVNYRRDGTLLVAIDEHECEELDHIYTNQTRLGLPLERLTGEMARKRVAGLSPQIKLALLVDGDHWLDNVRLAHALIKAGEKAGVEFHWKTTATTFEVQGGRVESVQATADQKGSALTFSAHNFVLAAGCWSKALAATLGLNLEMEPCHGQMIEFETREELPCVVRSGIHYVVPRGGRTVVAGTTAEYIGYEKAVTAEGLESIMQGVSRIAPLLKKAAFRRAWSGLRPDTKDHYPILGYGEPKNLVFATGHFRNGILLAPVTAKLISELLLTGSSSFPLETYSPGRFKSN